MATEPKHGDYYVCQHVDGFVVKLGDMPCIIVAGVIATRWEQAVPAIRHGWRLKAGLPDGSLIVERSTR